MFSLCRGSAANMCVSSWTIILIVSTFLLAGYGQLANAQDDCGSQETCTACIRARNCTWCDVVVDEHETQRIQRCVNQHYAKLADVNKWCSDGGTVIDPKTEVNLTDDRPLSSKKGNEQVQIRPQAVKLRLRRGEVHRLKVKYKQAEDYPVDLYFLVDLSNSMRSFRDRLSTLGDQIGEAMRNLTANFRLGFGSFVDKDTRPMTADRPKWDGFHHYSYKNQMPLTDDSSLFNTLVRSSPLTGNWDEPEGGLDGVMQVIVCTEEVAWRSDARHLLVYVSDRPPHIAGDGRLAGLPNPNDELCHLNSSGYYSYAELQDYPSLAQINWQARKNNINIIFATTRKYKPVYDEVQSTIEGSSVGIFNQRSENVVELISGQYEKLVKSLKMTSVTTSDALEVKFFSKCLDKSGELLQTDKCDGIRVNLEVEFDVHIKAIKCPERKEDWKQIIEIKPGGINERVIVEVELICDCECTKTIDEMKNAEPAKECNYQGVLNCGVCSCREGHFGKSCQCNGDHTSSDDESLLDNCRVDGTSPICNARGSCICGSCACGKKKHTEVHYYGKYCQCDDSSCEYAPNGKLCGGHGQCECGHCTCDPGWSGAACECRDDTSLCRPPGLDGKICSGMGKCECGECKCDQKSDRGGRFCEDCPSCPSQRCDEFKDCVECKIHKSGKLYAEDPACIKCPVEPIPVDDIDENPDAMKPGEHSCRIAGDDGSTFVFTYAYVGGETDKDIRIYGKKEKEYPVIDDFLAATLGVMLLTLLLGFLILLIWKIVTHMHDKREYDKFIKESSQADWGTGQNPLYKEVVSTFKNPAFNSSPGNNEL